VAIIRGDVRHTSERRRKIGQGVGLEIKVRQRIEGTQGKFGRRDRPEEKCGKNLFRRVQGQGLVGKGKLSQMSDLAKIFRLPRRVPWGTGEGALLPSSILPGTNSLLKKQFESSPKL